MGLNFFTAGLSIMACSVTAAFAAFSDDFNDPSSSSLKWVTSGETVTMQYVNNVCSITNTSATSGGLLYHTFSPGEKKEQFTLSAKITLGQGAASGGFACCLSMSPKVTGYDVSFFADGGILVSKMGTTSGNTKLVEMECAYVTQGANELKICRKDGVFNLSCNGHFVANFTDTEFPSGDIGLLADPKSTVVFDDVVMSDTFNPVAIPTCFVDNFDDGNLLGWINYNDNAARVAATGGALRIATSTGESVYEGVALDLKQFVMTMAVSFRGGTTQSIYGLFIRGAALARGTSTVPDSIPLAGFIITGGKYYGAFLADKSYSPLPSTSIKGAPFISSTGDTTFYKDTLQVIKRDGSAEYLFVVNADTLARLTGVNFAVTGVGILCTGGMAITCDDFVAAEGTSGFCPVVQPSIASSRGGKMPMFGSTIPDRRMFDLSGRMMSGRDAGFGSAAFAPGVYLRGGEKRVAYRAGVR